MTPYEHRKLWLLNGAHSLLAYAGSIRGHTTVAGAAADETCRSWLEEWWAVASPHLDQPAADVAAYRAALLERFGQRADARPAGPDRRRRLAEAPDPHPARPARRARGGPGARGRHPRAGRLDLPPARPRRAGQRRAGRARWSRWPQGPLGEAVPRVLGWLDPALGADADVVAIVVDQSKKFAQQEQVR